MARKVKQKNQTTLVAREPISYLEDGFKYFKFTNKSKYQEWLISMREQNHDIKILEEHFDVIELDDTPYALVSMPVDLDMLEDEEVLEIKDPVENLKNLEVMLKDTTSLNVYTIYQYTDTDGMIKTGIELRGNLPVDSTDLLAN